MDNFTATMFCSKKSVRDQILTHQMQVHSMCMKDKSGSIAKSFHQLLKDQPPGTTTTSRFSMQRSELMENQFRGQRRVSCMSRANSSLDNLGLRPPSRDRSKGNVSIVKKTDSSHQQPSTFMKL